MFRAIDDNLVPALIAVGTIVFVAALAMIFWYAPVERQMGIVQKIFYVHVPAAFAMYLGFGISAACSLAYLVDSSEHWDRAATTGATLGLIACGFVLISGPLWASKAWGTWWTWDPQLTATFVLFVMYAGYVILRQFGGSGRAIKKVSAVLALLAVVNIPIIHYAVELWGGMHPQVLRDDEGGLTAEMAQAFGMTTLGFLVIFALVFWVGFRTRSAEDRVETMQLDLADLAMLEERK